MVHPRVLQAMSTPLVGHLDPQFLGMMDVIQQQLRWLFRTRNEFTIALSGTGSAGMEAAMVNLVEPGDPVIVGINGAFGSRLAAIAERCGARVMKAEASWGRIIEADMVERIMAKHGPVKAVAVVHAETSTGVQQPLEEIGELCRRHDALFIVDAVTSLGGVLVEVDGWNMDACYSGTQKCVSCPPGLAPFTLSERATTTIRGRKTTCQSWYLDCSLIGEYWANQKRVYHHTAPISMLFALHEALSLIQAEGLAARIVRHRRNSDALMAGFETLGLHAFAQDGHRLPTLNCVTLPAHLDDRALRQELLDSFGIEIGGGLGPLQGKVWRIGLMGESSTAANVLTLLHALEEILARRGWLSQPGVALQAAAQTYARGI
jgi:alanine-glyoxylate transaminase / serine-glyoxylate transaminase / serine-pyruvate transaminase